MNSDVMPRLDATRPGIGLGEPRLHRLDRPGVVALVAFVAAALLAAARLAVFAHGDPFRFIVAGTRYASGADRYHPIYLFPSSGYDGQFFYRLALDPAQLGRTAFGISLDHPYRLQRIGYPVMAWLLAGGHGSLVPWSLIVLNVVGLGLLGLVSGALARDSGRHALAGLLLVGFWGYAFSLSRDTAEIPAAALTMGALLALRRRRPWWAAVLFAGAVLTRETSLVVVAAVALDHLCRRVRRGPDPQHRKWGAYAAWIAPSVAFLGWQLVIQVTSGGFAGTGGAATNLGTPFEALFDAVHQDLLVIPQVASVHDLAQLLAFLVSVRDLVQLIVLVGLTTLAVRSLRRSTAPTREKLAFSLMIVLAACLAPNDLVHLANQRSLDQLYLLAGLVLLGSQRRLTVPGSIASVQWLAVATSAVMLV